MQAKAGRSRRNPFRYLQPVPPAEFLGRLDLVEEVVEDVLAATGDSHAVIGGRRYGKTSLLTTLEWQIRAAVGSHDHLGVPLRLSFRSLNLTSEAQFFAAV